jgi:hypothetical protein
LLIRLNDDQKANALKLKKGDIVTFVGVLDEWGAIMPTTLSHGEIITELPAGEGQRREAPQEASAPPPQGMTLAAYLAQRPKEPTAITADCQLQNYYNFAYMHSADTHYSVTLMTLSPLKLAHAWVRKDSDTGKQVYEVLKDGASHRLTLEVVLQGPDGAPTPQEREEMAIVEVVTGAVKPADKPAESPVGKGQAPQAEEAVVDTLQVQTLWRAYYDNEAAADGKYTGKMVEVFEVCAPLFDYTPKKNRDGHYYLQFNCGIDWTVVIFRDSETDKLAQFDSHGMGGTKLTMRGKCQGVVSRHQVQGLSSVTVQVTDAVLVSVAKPSDTPPESPAGKEQQAQDQQRQKEKEAATKEQTEQEKARQAAIDKDHDIILRFVKKSVTDVKLEDVEWSGPSKAPDDKQRGRLYRLDCRYRVFGQGKVSVTYQFCLVDDAVTAWQRGDEKWNTVEADK